MREINSQIYNTLVYVIYVSTDVFLKLEPITLNKLSGVVNLHYD